MAHKSLLISDSGWRGVTAAFVLNGMLFGTWASRVPAFKESLELDPGLLGLLLLALAGGAIVSFPFAGALSEKLGAKQLTILCAAGHVPALVFLALAPSPLWLGLFLFVFGAFHGAMDVAMNGWGAQVENRLGRSTMSIFHAMFSLGAGLGAASGYFAARLGYDPVLQFAIMAVAGAVIAFAVMLSSPQEVVETDAGEGGQFFALPTGPLLLVGLIALSVSMGEGAMADWSAVFLVTVVQSSEATAALGYAVFSAMMVATRMAGGVAVERFGPVAVTRGSAATAFVGLMLAIFGNEVGLVLLGFALMGIGYAVVMPLVFSRAARDPQMAPGPAIASVAILGYGGMLLGPPIIGFVAQFSGMRLSFLVLAGLALLALLLAPRLQSRG
ncbi:MAG: MFS transporter [Hyphomicrobiales bacterium]|nr:MFS transporter [Hyphomicrobiales bacterium]